MSTDLWHSSPTRKAILMLWGGYTGYECAKAMKLNSKSIYRSISRIRASKESHMLPSEEEHVKLVSARKLLVTAEKLKIKLGYLDKKIRSELFSEHLIAQIELDIESTKREILKLQAEARSLSGFYTLNVLESDMRIKMRTKLEALPSPKS